MTIDRRLLLGLGVVLFSLSAGGPVRADDGDDVRIRWDIIRLSPGPAINAGGEASAKATNASTSQTETSTLTMTGSGTFEVPEKDRRPAQGRPRRDEEGDDVTGGGTWMITTGAVSSLGTYKVTGVVLWVEAPGTVPITDNIGNAADARAGLAVLRIEYSDGERGILVVSCSFVGTPNTVFEGITASKGFTDFWKAQPPTGTPTTPNANRTLFHVVRDDDAN